jgi:uncharacterized protein (TIGR02145 family)
MKMVSLLLVLPMLGIGFVRAQAVALSGLVTDREGRGLPGITVRLYSPDGIPGDTTYRATTSRDGAWAISSSAGASRSRPWPGSVRRVGGNLEVTLVKASQVSIESFEASGASLAPAIHLRLVQGTHVVGIPGKGALAWVRTSVDGKPVGVFTVSELERDGVRGSRSPTARTGDPAGRITPTSKWFLDVRGSRSLGVIPVARLDSAGILVNVDTSSSPPWSLLAVYGSLYDARDGRVYRTIDLGGRTWMAENLNYDAPGSRWAQGCRFTSENNCKLFDEEPRMGTMYGRLYSWATAMGLPDSCNRTWCLTPDSCRAGKCARPASVRSRGICPVGWHVPEVEEWDSLVAAVEALPGVGEGNGGRALRAKGGWATSSVVGSDVGFRALPAGYHDQNGLVLPGRYGYWRTATEKDSAAAHFRGIGFDIPYVFANWVDKAHLRSLRCLED